MVQGLNRDYIGFQLSRVLYWVVVKELNLGYMQLDGYIAHDKGFLMVTKFQFLTSNPV